MPSGQQQPQGPGLSDQQWLNVGWILLGGLASVDAKFLRSHMGRKEAGDHTLAGLAVMGVFLLSTPSDDLLPFAGAWLAAALYRRVESLRDHHFGTRQVLNYGGEPWAARLLVPFAGERTLKLLVEPPLAFGLGALLSTPSPAVGLLIQLSAAAMAIRQGVFACLERASDEAEADARLLMQQRAARMRGRR